jgi:rhodanese-related sulfurtransferase
VKFIVENWYLIVLALVSGALLAVPMLKGAAGGLTVANAVQLINREKAVLIDVCGADEYAAGHAGGSKSVPLGELEARLPSVVKNKAVPVVMVCASGGRATRAAAMARKLGYENAQVLAGGLKAWKDAGMPVEKS